MVGRSHSTGRPRPGRTPGQLEALVGELRRQGTRAGLAALGVAPAAPMEEVRQVLLRRKAEGLSGGMQFTYRNPARSTDPGRILAGAAALVVGALGYQDQEPAPPPDGTGAEGSPERPGGSRPSGAVARYARADHYARLREILSGLGDVLVAAGWRARVVVDDNALVDRAAAKLAGVGWFGKNTNVLLPGLGSWYLLGSVVTDAPLPTGQPVADSCGSCRRCLSSCPTGALVSPGVLDARRCLAWLLQAPGVFPFEHREALGDRIYGCDDCQEVCPVNRAADRAAAAGQAAAGQAAAGQAAAGQGGEDGQGSAAGAGDGGSAGGRVDLLEMLGAGTSDAQLMAQYGRWYIPARDPRYLRRNALIVLGNVADGRDAAVEAALRRHLCSSDELLQAHAVWAAARLGRADLLESLLSSTDLPPLVTAELGRRHEVTQRSL